jgi:sirohydrochlorin cobaltochelatase
MTQPKKAVLIVGHGAPASDTPREWVGELKRREAAKQPLGEFDGKVRNWKRTPQTDPYQAGCEAIAAQVRQAMPGWEVAVAYNEFCAPTIEDAVEKLLSEGAAEIAVIPTMYTRGGIHSEIEIPEIMVALRKKHPGANLRYVWPIDLAAIASFLSGQVLSAKK